MFPFDLHGPQFLQFYVPLLLGGFLAAFVLRQWLRGPDDEGSPSDRDLDPYAMAFLAGGGARVAETAIAHLVERGALVYEPTGRRLLGSPDRALRRQHPFERDVYELVPREGLSLEHLHAQARRSADAFFAKDLCERGLLLSSYQRTRLVLVLTSILGCLLLVGLVKFFIGMARNRPVGILMCLLLLSVGMSVWLMKGVRRSRLTRRGTRVLELLRIQNAALRTTASIQGSHRLQEKELLVLMGLFGLSVVNLPAIEALKEPLASVTPPRTQGGDGVGGGGGGGGDSSGGGDGGDGGGGCGGCGGGDGGGG